MRRLLISVTLIAAVLFAAPSYADGSTTATAAATTSSTVSSTSSTSAAPGPLQPVPFVDVNRYLGRWHQLAAIPQIFTWQCASTTTADYALTAAGDVSVLNTCGTWFGIKSSIKGTAKVLDTTSNAQLKVSFPFVPDFEGPTKPNYVITYLADDYSLALVGDPARRSGFLLSRGTALTEDGWRQARAIIEQAGYDSCRFVTTPTPGGRSDYRKLCTF